jgi:hypothetical protein
VGASRPMTAESASGGGRVPRFGRQFFQSAAPITRIGDGELGGKAHGLVLIRDLLASQFDASRFASIDVYVPKMVVLTTEIFDVFMDRNDLTETALSDLPDDRITTAFLAAELPYDVVGDLRSLVEQVRTPLAVRSSSLLEDALMRPFAGVYETKMIPNNEPDVDVRFRRLVEAIKFVYASTFFRSAKSYIRATEYTTANEKMAVIIQEVVGTRRDVRFYPDISGVARSYNFFPASGSRPEDGVVNLAVGLGKTIVDGGQCWIYSPMRPLAPPPLGSTREMLRSTQLDFWAVNMGKPPAYDPLSEAEYLVKADLAAADYDGTLDRSASTYDPGRDRLVPGVRGEGARVVNFAPLLALGDPPLNPLVQALLAMGETALGEAVEIEFAMTSDAAAGSASRRDRFGFLQLRPMLVSQDRVFLSAEEIASPDALLVSDRVMGNGELETLTDVVYVRPDRFEARLTRAIAGELDGFNARLLEEGRPYMVIGFGRWGSSDPWLGIPVVWGQISGAKVLVESTLAGMDVEPSQGAHFFHNIVSFQVFYLGVRHRPDPSGRRRSIDWEWLDRQPVVTESEHVRHVRLDNPLRIKVDGRSGVGAVWHR